ncbi:MAG: SidA/IucD/PvdA family monooxygenase, partial [Mucilaginibacter polytrichastri]|nr:SidA/IucD/PvdA family monooxygenase [Mucilaginibacter polytrichastri]
SGWRLTLDDGTDFYSDVILLLPGTPDTNMYTALKEHEKYIHSPWPSSEMMRKISPDDEVAILGSGLSAIDAVMTLADHKHKGPVTMYSPDGLLPRVQPVKESSYSCQYLTPQTVHRTARKKLRGITIKDLYRLYRKDVTVLSGQDFKHRNSVRDGHAAKELLEQDIATAEKGGDALMQVVYATRDYSSAIWLMLTDSEKKTFADGLASYWAINRHAMPLPNAQRLLELFKDEQLHVRPFLNDVQFDHEKKAFRLSSDGQDHVADVVVNAVGTSASVKKMESALVGNLLKSGLVCEAKSGGISIDPFTMQVIDVKGQTGTMYTAGHLANGILLDVNAVWFNVRTIDTLCGHLTGHIERKVYG